MMREVVGAISAAFTGTILLWFMLPMLATQYSFVVQTVNATDPIIAPMLQLGNGVYTILPYIVFVVTGYLIFAYATRIEPFDR